MPRTNQQGHYQFCVDLGMPLDDAAMDAHRLHARLTEEMVAIFSRFDIAATWAVPSAQAERNLRASLAADPLHEIALLASSDWVGPTVSRQSVKLHLDSFFQHALDAGLQVSSVVARDVDLGASIDLFLKHGILLVRESSTEAMTPYARRDASTPRGNVWHVLPTCQFPSSGGLWSRLDQGFRAKKVLRRSLVRKSTEHVAIRISEIMRRKRPELVIKSLERLLQVVSKLQATKRIKSESLRDAINRWQPVKVQPPQRSVLRPAA